MFEELRKIVVKNERKKVRSKEKKERNKLFRYNKQQSEEKFKTKEDVIIA